jgi:hypothetical protein
VQTGWRHRPTVGAPIRVKPCAYLIDALSEAMRQHADPYAHRETAIGVADCPTGNPHRAAHWRSGRFGG